MTFYEAALQILQREGKPLHAREITEQAIKDNLLSHVGMQPEVTMASRLAAMARRSQDRRLVAVEPDTFGLVDWSVEVSPDALELSGVEETHDESEPLLRTRERHPKVDKDNVRVAGRSDRRRKYEEIDRKKKKKKKRLPPLPELVYEILDRTGRAVPAFDLAAAIREHDLLGDDIGREALEKSLRSENERREGEDRNPVFTFLDDGLVGLVGREEPEEEVDLLELVTKVVARLAEERKPAGVEVAPAMTGSLDELVAAERERAVGLLRQRLAELEAPALEVVTQAMLETLGYRDVRVAKRHKDGSLFTTKRRMGLTEVRFALRVIRGSREVRREDVLELRRDMVSHSAQMGVLLSPADVTREGRSEAAQSGAPLVTLLCADALAEQLAERGLGVRQRQVTIAEFDPAAFRALAGGAQVRAAAAPAAGASDAKRESSADRRERRDRERKEWREKRARERDERRKTRETQTAAGETPADEENAAERAVAGGGQEVAETPIAPAAVHPSIREPSSAEDFVGADLVGADLVGADLVGADLVGADLVGADLVGAEDFGPEGEAAGTPAAETIAARIDTQAGEDTPAPVEKAAASAGTPAAEETAAPAGGRGSRRREAAAPDAVAAPTAPEVVAVPAETAAAIPAVDTDGAAPEATEPPRRRRRKPRAAPAKTEGADEPATEATAAEEKGATAQTSDAAAAAGPDLAEASAASAPAPDEKEGDN